MAQTVLYRFGAFCLDVGQRLLLRDGRLVPLAPKALNTLLVLLENRGQVVEKDFLMAQVWPDEIVEEGNLAQLVFMVRRALGETPELPSYIETVPRRGYRFLCEVTELSTSEHEAIALSLGIQHQPAATRVESEAHRLAVLPFVNASGDDSLEPLSEGITESLINTLSRLPQLRVSSRNTVYRYKEKETDPKHIGRELQVQSVLLGRIHRMGNTLIVGTELVDVANGWQLWGAAFNNGAKDIFQIQDEITTEISSALQLRLQVAHRQQLTRQYTANVGAYQSYVKGRFYWNKRSEAGVKKSIGYYQQALTFDPQYALAYTGIADSFNILGFYSMLPPSEAFPKAKASAIKALELDSNLASAHASLGFSKLLYDWDEQGSEQSFKRSICLDPNYVAAHLFYGCHLVSVGLFDKAIAEYKHALEIDPLSLITNAALAYGYYFGRRYDEAINQCSVAIEMDDHFQTAHLWLGWSYEAKGMFEKAIAEYEKALALSENGTSIMAALGRALALSGKKHRAQKVIMDLTKLTAQKYVSHYDVAGIHAALGDVDQAFISLEKAHQDRCHSLVGLRFDPKFDSLRSIPRLAGLIERIVARKTYPESGEAHKAYLKGRYCWSQHTRERLARAIEYFRQAIDLDSDYLPAYAALTDCYFRLTTNYFLPSDPQQPIVDPEGVDGIENIPTEIQASLKSRDEWDLSNTQREVKRANDLKLPHPEPRQWHAVSNFSRHLYRETLAELRIDQQGGPVDPRNRLASGVDPSEQGCSTGLTPTEEVQILCIVAREQVDAGNTEAGRLALKRWYVFGEWPRLEGLGPQSAADLLLTAGFLAGRLASSRQTPRGQIHAEALLNGAISLFEHLGLKMGAAEGTSELGRCYDRQGMFDLACQSFLASLRELPAEHRELRCRTLLRLAFAEMKAGRLHDSRARLKEASEIVGLAGPSNMDFFHIEMATTFGELAIAENSHEYFDNACKHYLKALSRSEAVGHHRRTAVLENNRGHLLLAFGRLKEAEPLLMRARRLFNHFSDPCPQLDEILARFYLEAGRLDVAELTIVRSVETLETGGEEALLAESLRTQGRVLCKLGRVREAKRALDRAYQIAERCGDGEGAGLALLIMAEELSEPLPDDERVEVATSLNRLLGQSQRISVRHRLAKCLASITSQRSDEKGVREKIRA